MHSYGLRIVKALAVLFALAAVIPAWSQNTLGVFTNRYDNGRTGQNRFEKVLTPQNVNGTSFGKLLSYSVDGQIYAQPLYVVGVNIPGKGKHNVVYVPTQLDSVYAFDADGKSSTPLWQVNFTDLTNGIGPVPCGSTGGGDISCSVAPYYGITGTPVIDPDTNTMYLIARTFNFNTNEAFQYLHALDITSGAEKFGGPVEIIATFPGAGMRNGGGLIQFNPLGDIQRAGLLLLNKNGKKTVYIGWTGGAHGWLMGYDAQTLAQVAVLNTTPNGYRGGVWQSGNGLAADSNGYIYVGLGDGPFDADSGGVDYGDSLLKLDGNLNVVDYFTPFEQACRLAQDYDLGSSGPMVVPTQSGQFPNEVITSGKGGNPCDSTGTAPIYVVNRDSMGKYNPNLDNVVQEISGSPTGYWSSAAYWQSASQAFVYYGGTVADGGVGDYLKIYSLTNGLLSTSPISQSNNIFPVGVTPTVSSSGNNSGILWAIKRTESLDIRPGQLPAVLYAYDATNLATMFYDSSQNPARDQGGCATKFQVPTVANGKVYVTTQNELDIFGPLSLLPPVLPRVYFSSPCNVFPKQPVGTTSTPKKLTLTNSGNAPLKITRIALVGYNASDFAQNNNCPATLAPGAKCSFQVTFTPSATGARIAQLLVTDNAGGSPQNIQLSGLGI